MTTWKPLGIPDFLQLDNDAAFAHVPGFWPGWAGACGGYKTPRLFGQFVRLCLYLGIELIFCPCSWPSARVGRCVPVAEPKCNGEIEEFNGLWGGLAFWERHRFASTQHVARLRPKFIEWYLTDYV